MPRKNVKYNCPPRRGLVRCPVCNKLLHCDGFYQHIRTHK
jgi:hypothetical protein